MIGKRIKYNLYNYINGDTKTFEKIGNILDKVLESKDHGSSVEIYDAYLVKETNNDIYTIRPSQIIEILE